MSSTTIFKVRPATLRDAKSIAELHNASAREAFKSIIGDVPIADVPLDKRQAFWREAIEYSEPQVQVVLDDEKIGMLAIYHDISEIIRARRAAEDSEASIRQAAAGALAYASGAAVHDTVVPALL